MTKEDKCQRMDCPICLDQLKEAIVLNCGHLCCHPCHIAAESTHCRVCRVAIQTTTPVNWFNTQHSFHEDQSQSLESLSSHEDQYPPFPEDQSHSSKDGGKEQNRYKDKLIESSLVIETRCLPVEPRTEKIMSNYEQRMEYINDKYDDKIKRLEEKRNRKLEKLRNDTQNALNNDANKIKQTEYYNQGLLHVAQTCRALSTQPDEIIEQALIQYQRKIEESMFDWPLGLSPAFPYSFNYCRLKYHSFESDSYIHGKMFTYIRQINDFVYVYRDYLKLRNTNCRLKDSTILHIAYDSASNNGTLDNGTLEKKVLDKKVLDNGAIYVLHRSDCYVTYISRYNLRLGFCQISLARNAVFLYIDNGIVHKIENYVEDNTINGYVTQFRGQEIRFYCDEIINAIVHGNKLYITDVRRKTCAYPVNESIKTTKVYPNDLKRIFDNNSSNFQVFVKDGILYKYLYKDGMTYLYRDGDPQAIGKPFPDKGSFYPGARNTLIYHKDKQFELVEL